MKSKKIHQFRSKTGLSLLVAIGALLLFNTRSQAQVECQIPGYKIIVGDFDAPDLYGAQLTPPSQAQNTPQFLVIDGRINFTEDYKFAQGSDIIFLDNDSGFSVSYAATLYILKSDLRGCTKLWAGVEAKNGSTLVVYGSVIEDAKAAIILRNESTVGISENIFRKNACGIIAVNSITGSFATLYLGSRTGISSNTFFGNDQLLESISTSDIDPYLTLGNLQVQTTDYPYAGIWLERVNALTIGHSYSADQANKFIDYGQHETDIRVYGIYSWHSNVKIVNATFENFGIFTPSPAVDNLPAIGAYARNDAIPNIVTVISEGSTFSNCIQDIETVGTSLTVTDITSHKAALSIDGKMANSWQNPVTYSIKDNEIDYFRSAGIVVNYFKPILINIEGNLVFDNDELNDPAFRYGIVVEKGGPNPVSDLLKDSRVFKNQIKSRSKLPNGAFFGIVNDKVSGLTIEQNNIWEELAPSNLFLFYGIRTLGSPNSNIKLLYNTINGSGLNYEFATGIYLNEALNSVLHCNSTDNLNTGIAVFNNCNNADIRNNQFNYHDIGFALGHPDPQVGTAVYNQTGLQTDKENRWYGSNSNIEAFAFNEESALASIFEINSSDLNSFFWPSPRQIGANPDNFTWFISSDGPEADGSVDVCANPIHEPDETLKPRLANTDIEILNDTYESPFEYPAMDWETRWEFADRIHQNPGLLDSSGVAEYYQETYEETYTSLNRDYQKYLQRWQPEDPLTAIAENYSTSLMDNILYRFTLDSLLSINASENTHLHAQMAQVDNAIRELSSLAEEATENLNTLIDSQVSSLLGELNEIECSEEYETDMQNVLEVMLLSHLNGDVLTNTQISDLEVIADKCRYSGGYAVLLARSLLEPQESYEQDIACESGQFRVPPQVNQPVMGALEVFPNPANDAIILQIGQSFDQGIARIFNTQGLLLSRTQLQEQRVKLPTHNLKNGTYIIEVQLDDKPALRKPFIINR